MLCLSIYCKHFVAAEEEFSDSDSDVQSEGTPVKKSQKGNIFLYIYYVNGKEKKIFPLIFKWSYHFNL